MYAIALIALLMAPGDEPTRAARSVHLRYPAPEAQVFYNEMTVVRSTPGSYFMACGFTGGYFGIQELVDGKKIALFSVWDPGKQDDPDVVAKDKRVEVIGHNPNATVKRFGGEGTGAQCLLDFDWKIGETYCFAVLSRSGDGRTIYSAYFRTNGAKDWVPLATYRAISSREGLSGLYSFIEDFRRDTRSAQDSRRATFGNGWVRLKSGRWQQLGDAQFTASGASFEAKDSINAGVEGERFFLETGGDTKQRLQLKDTIERPLNKRPPPEVPQD